VAPEGCGEDWRCGANEEKTRFQPKLAKQTLLRRIPRATRRL